jgi:hypothetical protein
MSRQYTVGTAIRLEAVFTDEAGTEVDPTAVEAELLLPDGSIVKFTGVQVIKTATGNYYVDYTPTANGLYQYRFDGTGTVIAANEGYFTADSSFSS